MSFKELIETFPWERYSRKMASQIEKHRQAGYFTAEDAEARGVRLVISQEGMVDDGNAIRFYWLVDKDDGQLIDVKYQVYGQSALIGAAEAAAQLLIGKNYDQARRVTTDLIDKEVRDSSNEPAFPKETSPHLNLVLSAIDRAADQCTDIPLPSTYVAPPMTLEVGEIVEGGIPGWEGMSREEQIGIIEQVLDNDIRPYIALDAGGVEVINLIEGKELIIGYQGACTSCYSSVGTTLSYIQQILRAKVHPDLVVTPNLEMPFR